MSDDPRLLVLAEMRKQTALLSAILSVLTERTPMSAANTPPTVDLDSPHGNPVVKAKDPRDWTGEPMKGRTFSECPADYLDLVAERLDYFSAQLGDSADDQKKRKYNTLDAARARGWAARKRAGWTAPEPVAGLNEGEREPRW